jgi:PPIC-type PPIASE domain
MKLPGAWLVLMLACASAPTRDPGACGTPADRAEILQVQVGWNRMDAPGQPPVIDVQRPSRDVRQAESLANDLLAQCRKGASMESLQDRYSEVPAGSVVVGRQAKVPFKAVALCLRKNECALVRSSVAFHVLKRIG